MTERSVVNVEFDVIRAFNVADKLSKFFGKLSKTSRKGSLELQKVENWTWIASKELTESTWQEKQRTLKFTIVFHTQTKLNAQVPLKKHFARDRMTKLKKTRASGYVGWYLFDTKQYIFSQRRHTKFYSEDTV